MAKATKLQKKKFESAGRAYAKMMKPLNKSGTTSDIKRSAQMQFLKEYKDVMKEFMYDTTLDLTLTDVSSDFKELFMFYYENLAEEENRRNSQNNDAENSIEQAAQENETEGTTTEETATQENETGEPKLADRVLDSILGKEENDGEEEQSNLSGAQMNGLKEISKWMLRNMEKTGIGGESKSAFVLKYILKQPARVKLCAYYLVETDARKLTGDKLKNAILKSQDSNYVPNLNRFKKKMISSKFKFWKRINGNEFYWDKLETAMRIAVNFSGVLAAFGSLGAVESAEVGTENEQTSDESNTSNSQNGDAESANDNESALIAYNNFLEKKRVFEKLLQAKAVGKKQKTWKKEQEALFDEKQTEYLQSIRILVYILNNGKITDIEDFDTSEGMLSDLEEALGTGEEIYDKASTHLEEAGELFTNEAVQEGFGAAGTVFGASASLVSFGGWIVNIIRMAKKDSYTTSAEKTEVAFSALESLGGILESGLESSKDIMELIGKSGAALESAAGVVGVATGGVSFIKNTVSFGTSLAGRNHLNKFSKQMENNTELTANEKEKSSQIVEMQKRLLEKKTATAAVGMFTSSLQIAAGALALTGVGAIVGAALSAIALGISLVSSIVGYFKKKSNMNATIDDYIHMEEIYPKIKEKIDEETSEQPEKIKAKIQESRLKEQIRLEAAAILGFSSIKNFYNYITREYAEFIYSKAMLNSDGEEIQFDENGKPILSQTNEDFAKLLQSYGLKPNYKKKKPSVNTIQKKMENI